MMMQIWCICSGVGNIENIDPCEPFVEAKRGDASGQSGTVSSHP